MQELKFNKRRKLDRFLATLPKDMVLIVTFWDVNVSLVLKTKNINSSILER